MDSISLELFKGLFAAVAEEMGVALRRSSFSPNIKERLDYSCAVFDAAGRMVAQAAHIPVHLGSMPASVAAALHAFPQMGRGDLVALNDPYHGGTHLPDITMVSPVCGPETDLPAFYVASRAHHADVGGMSPGSLPLSTELYQEGLIIPPVLLIAGGQHHVGIFDLIAANSRTPDERRGDLDAQLAAHQVGATRLREILTAHGQTVLDAHVDALIAYTRAITADAIAQIPDGTYTFTDWLEGDGQSDLDIPIRATITVAGARLTVDFAGTAPQVAGNLNAVPAIVRSATWYCIRLLIDEEVPMNAGSFDPITVLIPAGSLLDPHFPAAVAVGNTETSQRIVDVVLGALALALPDRIPAASQGTMNNITCGGYHNGQPFIYYETIGGGHGGGPLGPGISGRQSHMTNTLNTPIEALEYALPMRIWTYALRDGSGGAGQHTGGAGIERVYEFLASATVTLNTERRRHGPYGRAGGATGQTGRNLFLRGATTITLGAKATVQVQPGDRISIATPGGGGWGIPEEAQENPNR